MHLWALFAAAAIAATVIGSLTLSNVASAISCGVALAMGFILTQVARSLIELDHGAMVVSGAAMATCVVSLTLLVALSSSRSPSAGDRSTRFHCLRYHDGVTQRPLQAS